MSNVSGRIGGIQGVYNEANQFIGISDPSTTGDGADFLIPAYATDANNNITGFTGLVKNSDYTTNLSDFQTLDDAISSANLNQYTAGAVPKINLGICSITHEVSANSLKTCELVGTTFSTTYSSVASVTGLSNNYIVTLNVASTANISVNDYVGLTPNPTLTGVNALALVGSAKVTAKTSSTITFTLDSPVAPSGVCAGDIKIYKSVIALSLPLMLTFDLRMKDVAVIPTGSFFVSDNSTLTNDGGLFYGDGSTTLYVSRGAQFYADFSFYSKMLLRFDYGAHGHIDNICFRGVNTFADALLTVSEASQVSAWNCYICGGELAVNCVAGSFVSLTGSVIGNGNRGIKAAIRSTIDAYSVSFVGVVGVTNSPTLDTLGNGNSYINSLIDIFEV